jgi:N-acetylglucosamine-6-sulfatase
MEKRSGHPVSAGRGVLARLLLVAALVVMGVADCKSERDEVQSTSPPNIVLILTDDQQESTLAHMPKVQDVLISGGAKLENTVNVYPLCCPTRATIQRGQYAHNTGVFDNEPPNGGWPVFDQNELERSTVATWLHDAGYHTGYIGKYMNFYFVRTVPPGWDRWFVLIGDNYASSNSFKVNDQGTLRDLAGGDRDVLIARKALSWIQDAAPRQQQFFVQVGFTAPHNPSNYDSRDATSFSTTQMPRTPNFNEADVSDKSSWIARRRPLGSKSIKSLDGAYRNRLRDLQTVDAFVSDLRDVLTGAGEWQNTYVLYYSDNGYHMGQHRLAQGKRTYFQEDIAFPLITRGPGIPSDSTSSLLVGSHDIAPTIADMAGVQVPAFVDGRSALPVLQGTQDRATWRTAIYSEHRFGTTSAPEWEMIRTEHQKYVSIKDSPAEEFYDLSTDPYELTNLIKSGGITETTLDEYRARLAKLRQCEGVACRAAEDGL